MKLLNTIRIFLWLKIKETWKKILIALAVIFIPWATGGVLTKIVFNTEWSQVYAFDILPIFINYIFGIGVCGILSCIIIGIHMCLIPYIGDIVIPWLKQNWQEAKRISESEAKK